MPITLLSIFLAVSFGGGVGLIIRGRLPISKHRELRGNAARVAGTIMMFPALVAVSTNFVIMMAGLAGGFSIELGVAIIITCMSVAIAISATVLAFIIIRFSEPKPILAELVPEQMDLENIDADPVDNTFNWLTEQDNTHR